MTKRAPRGAKQLFWVAASVALLNASCVTLAPSTSTPDPVEVELVNQALIDLRPNFFISSSATTAEALFDGPAFTGFTDRAFPELRGQENITLTFDCDDLRALGTSRASLFDPVTLTRIGTEDVIFLLKDADFACGDRLQLVYFTQDGALRVRLERPE